MEVYTSPLLLPNMPSKKYVLFSLTLFIIAEISLLFVGVHYLLEYRLTGFSIFLIYLIIISYFVAALTLIAIILTWIDRDGSRTLRIFKESFTKKMKIPKVGDIYIGVYKNRLSLIILFAMSRWDCFLWLVNVAIPYDVGIKLLDAYFKRNARHSKIRTEKNRIAVEFPELGETYFFDKKYIKDIIFIKTIVEDQYEHLKKMYESLEPLKYHYYVMRGLEWMGFEMKKFS